MQHKPLVRDHKLLSDPFPQKTQATLLATKLSRKQLSGCSGKRSLFLDSKDSHLFSFDCRPPLPHFLVTDSCWIALQEKESKKLRV